MADKSKAKSKAKSKKKKMTKKELEKKQAEERKKMNPADRLVSKADSLSIKLANSRVIDYLTTGITTLDLSISTNGVPGGAIIELYGPFGSGKTALALNIGKAAQERGGIVVYIDKEGGFSEDFADNIINICRDPSCWLYYNPEDSSQAIDLLEGLCLEALDLDVPTVFIVDSIAALFDPKLEIDQKRFSEVTTQPASRARFMSKFLNRGLSHKIRGSRVYVIFTNQLRTGFKFLPGGGSIAYDKPTGGEAMGFYSDIRIKLDVGPMYEDNAQEKEGKNSNVGRMHYAKIEKNKYGQPFRESMFPIYNRKDLSFVGFDNAHSCILYLSTRGCLNQANSWFELGGIKRQGLGNLVTAVRTDSDILDYIVKLTEAEYAKEYGGL